MIADLGTTLELEGISGKPYIFNLYSFENFNELDGAFKSRAALYLFTRRYWRESMYYHELIYLGQTTDLSNRFAQHHKKEQITMFSANCIGIFTFIGTDPQLMSAESDLLESYDFPCNDINNK